MRTARLLGSQHTELGTIDGVAIGSAAIALSRGGSAKTYAHVDPNEDCAGLVVGPGGILVCVADGHDGSHGAEAATTQLVTDAGPRWCATAAPVGESAELAYAEMQRASDAVARAAASQALPIAPTTLAFAAIRPAQGRITYAAAGDSHVFLANAQGAAEIGWQALGRERAHFLGPPEESWHREDTSVGSLEVSDALALVLATDGLSEAGIGVTDPAGTVSSAVEEARTLEPARRAQWLARRVVEISLDSHRNRRSGDNIAVAVVWLASTR